MIKKIHKDDQGRWSIETHNAILPCHGDQDLVATLVFCLAGYEYEKYLKEVCDLLRLQTDPSAEAEEE